MTEPLRVFSFRLTAAPRSEVRAGLLGHVSFVLGNLRLNGIALRRTRSGQLVLSYPERRDARGGRHPVVRPLDDETPQAIEAEVFRTFALDRDEVRP